MVRLICIPAVAAKIGTIVDTDALGIVVSVDADGKRVRMAGDCASQVMSPAAALRLADLLAYAAREALTNDTEDVVDHNTRWV